MRYVSATDTAQRVAALLDAAQREPSIIRKQNREVALLRSRTSSIAGFQRSCGTSIPPARWIESTMWTTS